MDWDRLSNAPRPVVTLCLRSPVAGNVDDDKEIDEIYTLLTENDVEDDDAWRKALPSRVS